LRIFGPKISGSSIRNLRRALIAAGLACCVAPPAAVGQGAPPSAPVPPATTPPPQSAFVESRVVKPSEQGEVPVPGVTVTLHRVGPDSAGPVDSMRTDAAGRYAFRFRRWGSPDAVYFAASVYDGIAYFSAPLRGVTMRGDEHEIMVFDTTSRTLRFGVQGHHIVVGAPRPTGLRDIVEVYELSNDTVVTAVGRDSLTPVWSAPLPAGAANFVGAPGDVAASALEMRDGKVVMLAPFGPGVKQISFSYALAPGAFPLVLALDRPNALLEVLLEEPGAQVRGGSLRSDGNVTTEGRTFKRFIGQSVPQGEQVRIDVPSTAAAARSTFVIAIAVGLVLAMTAALAVAYRRGGSVRRVAPAVALDGPDALAAAIAALDARHEARDPTLSPADYDAQRAALKARLSAALAGGAGPR
jgi:hypothetical protein